MMSSDGFGGGSTGAGPRIQIGSAAGAESGTVLSAQQQVALAGQRYLLANDVTHLHRGGPLGQGIEVGVVGRLGVGREDRGIHLDLDRLADFREAPAALAPHDAVDVTPPQVLAIARSLELAGDVYRPVEAERQPFE